MKKVFFLMAMCISMVADAAITATTDNGSVFTITVNGEDLVADIIEGDEAYQYVYDASTDSIYVTEACIGRVRSVAEDIRMATIVLQNRINAIETELSNVVTIYNPMYYDVSIWINKHNLQERLNAVNKSRKQNLRKLGTLRQFLHQAGRR